MWGEFYKETECIMIIYSLTRVLWKPVVRFWARTELYLWEAFHLTYFRKLIYAGLYKYMYINKKIINILVIKHIFFKISWRQKTWQRKRVGTMCKNTKQQLTSTFCNLLVGYRKCPTSAWRIWVPSGLCGVTLSQCKSNMRFSFGTLKTDVVQFIPGIVSSPWTKQ